MRASASAAALPVPLAATPPKGPPPLRSLRSYPSPSAFILANNDAAQAACAAPDADYSRLRDAAGADIREPRDRPGLPRSRGAARPGRLVLCVCHAERIERKDVEHPGGPLAGSRSMGAAWRRAARQAPMGGHHAGLLGAACDPRSPARYLCDVLLGEARSTQGQVPRRRHRARPGRPVRGRRRAASLRRRHRAHRSHGVRRSANRKAAALLGLGRQADQGAGARERPHALSCGQHARRARLSGRLEALPLAHRRRLGHLPQRDLLPVLLGRPLLHAGSELCAHGGALERRERAVRGARHADTRAQRDLARPGPRQRARRRRRQ